ncbi:hypothetical protein CEXT_106261 [Caerostris extrusa]|uniref:Secreted protein n=1 Tax=Caerostris extrusa TaxID=172846 RepID=A0AAV4Q7E3_CAEEX|nr:hypothetical protein CEXT_106261 [Caerostris extrusa]
MMVAVLHNAISIALVAISGLNVLHRHSQGTRVEPSPCFAHHLGSFSRTNTEKEVPEIPFCRTSAVLKKEIDSFQMFVAFKS